MYSLSHCRAGLLAIERLHTSHAVELLKDTPTNWCVFFTALLSFTSFTHTHTKTIQLLRVHHQSTPLVNWPHSKKAVK